MKTLLTCLSVLSLGSPMAASINYFQKPNQIAISPDAEKTELWNESLWPDEIAKSTWANWSKTARFDIPLEKEISYESLGVSSRNDFWDKYSLVSFKTNLYGSAEDESGWGDHSYNKNKTKAQVSSLVVDMKNEKGTVYSRHFENVWTKSSQSKHREVSVTLTVEGKKNP